MRNGLFDYLAVGQLDFYDLVELFHLVGYFGMIAEFLLKFYYDEHFYLIDYADEIERKSYYVDLLRC